LVIEKFGSFRLWVSLGLSGFVYFAESVLLPFLAALRCLLFRLRWFDFRVVL